MKLGVVGLSNFEESLSLSFMPPNFFCDVPPAMVKKGGEIESCGFMKKPTPMLTGDGVWRARAGLALLPCSDG